MYLAVEFEYSSQWGKFTDDEWLEIRTAVPSLPGEKPQYMPQGTHFVTDAAIPTLAKHKISFHLSDEPASNAVGTMLVKLQDRLDDLGARQQSTAELVANGCVVQIAIPDFGLLNIGEVTYLENACTERVQELLEDGWRILAVCPPNAQRRPDFIFGRRKTS